MRKRKKLVRGHRVVLDIPEKKYKRWSVVNGNERLIKIDFRCIRADKFHPVDYGARRCYIWNNPEQLQGMVDEYFASCYGPVKNPKTGGFYEKDNGELLTVQIKPFTISGLALYCHIATDQIKKYSDERIDALGMPTDEDYVGLQYSQILKNARQKIETYAEERLYDKDGFSGGKFVLDCAFGWLGSKELADIKALKKQLKIKQKELELREQQLLQGEADEEPINITVKRAGED